jgi:DNA-binding MarR family transcriptional regulator
MHMHIDCEMAIGANSPAFQVWVRLVRSHQRIRHEVEAALKSEGLPPLEWYDVLLELERHNEPLRARDLEQKLLLAQYNLSRLLDRLEKPRLIIRRPDPADGRSRLIQISDKGLATRRNMWPVYRRVVEGSIGARLTALQANDLAGLLALLASSDEPASAHGASA